MKYLLLLLLITISLQLSAQTPLPYYTGFDNANERAGWVQFRQGYLGLYDWNFGAGFSAPNSIAHDYPVGSASTDTTVDWFVSPPFDFTNGGIIDSIKVKIFSITGSTMPIDYLGAYLLVGSNNPSVATSTVELGNFKSLVHNNGNWSDTGNFAIPPTSGNCYIGIKYRATNNWFVVDVDNIKISANPASGIFNTTNSSAFNIYPNPVSNQLIIISKQSIVNKIEVANILGQLQNVSAEKINANKFQLNTMQLSKGIYYVKTTDDKGLIYVTKFLKN